MASGWLSSGLDKFHAAAGYAGFGVSFYPSAVPDVAISRFKDDVAFLLYGLYQQATIGPCNVPKPRSFIPAEHSKWASWHGLGNMVSEEAMRMFVKILEDEDPAWSFKIPDFTVQPIADVQIPKPNPEPSHECSTEKGNSLLERKTISAKNEVLLETQDKKFALEGLGSVSLYDQWVAPTISGNHPKPRYSHGAAVLQENMYIFGGSHSGRYLNDLWVLDLKSLAWSRINAKQRVESAESSETLPVAPCAGHSLISWRNKILCVAGHTKNQSDTITVKEFDPQSCLWSTVKTYGNPPVSRGGQSATLVRNSLVVFGGEDAKRNLLNDLHILNLVTMVWNSLDAVGTPPSPRSDHAAACHADHYLLIFGGSSYATCFNDLYVLDLEGMEWSMPKVQGVIPGPRAGHAGVTVGGNWFIAGGGNNTSGVSETLMLNMSEMVWSVVNTVEKSAPIASEGLSIVRSTHIGEDLIVSFGGYNGHYNNAVYVLKTSYKSDIKSKDLDASVLDNTVQMLPVTTDRDVQPEIEATEDTKIREIVMDNVDAQPVINSEIASQQSVAALKTEKEELEAALNNEKLQNLRVKQDLAEAEFRNVELTKELQFDRGQLAAEQSRCFKLEVDVAELRQKLQVMKTLEREVELLYRQKAASEQIALNAQRESSGGRWGWLTGTPLERSDSL